MEEILNNMSTGEILHTTNRNTNYLLVRWDRKIGVTYSINHNRKTLPFDTIIAGLAAQNRGKTIDRQWYRNFNLKENNSSPCNLSVLRNLLNRMNQ